MFFSSSMTIIRGIASLRCEKVSLPAIFLAPRRLPHFAVNAKCANKRRVFRSSLPNSGSGARRIAQTNGAFFGFFPAFCRCASGTEQSADATPAHIVSMIFSASIGLSGERPDKTAGPQRRIPNRPQSGHNDECVRNRNIIPICSCYSHFIRKQISATYEKAILMHSGKASDLTSESARA